MTPGQIAHDAGKFERKWERMGESQKADWECIAQAVIQQERNRFQRIVYDECMACGEVGEQAWINIKSKVRNPLKTEGDTPCSQSAPV